MKQLGNFCLTIIALALIVPMIFATGLTEIFEGFVLSTAAAEVTNATDYSDLTANQYMTKVMLNWNYIGADNSYGETPQTTAQFQKEWFTQKSNVSPSSFIYNDLKQNTLFQIGVAEWRVLTYDPSEAYENLLDEVGYYEAILLSILDVQIQDTAFLEAAGNSLNKTIMSLSKSTAQLASAIKKTEIKSSNLKNEKVSDYTESELTRIISEMMQDTDDENAYDLFESTLSNIHVLYTSCTTLEDIIQAVGGYAELAKVNDSIKNVLCVLYETCPSSNQPMKTACQKVYEAVTQQLDDYQRMCFESLDAVFGNVFKQVIGQVIGDMWKIVKEGLCTQLSQSLLTGMKIGQAVGKSISNFCFSTDAVIEQYEAIGALLNFEDVMATTLQKLEKAYKLNESVENADNYIAGLKLMFAMYSLDCDYAYGFSKVAWEKGLCNQIRIWINGQCTSVTEFQTYVRSIQNTVERVAERLTCLEGYRFFYEEDAPRAYEKYFNPPSGEAAVYSKNARKSNYHPMYDIANGNYTVLEYVRNADKTVTVTKCMPYSTGVVTIPKDVAGIAIRTIEASAFQNCSGITKVICPSTLRTIGSKAFYGCTGLASVELNNGLETIGGNAFSGTSLTSITIPKTVKDMDSYYGVDSCLTGINTLKKVVFTEGMERIPDKALYKCTGVTEIVIPGSVKTIGSEAFSGCMALPSIMIPDSVQIIDSKAFSGCTGLTSVIIPGNVQQIRDRAFMNCSELASVVLQDGLETIGGNAFSGTSLTSITIPKTVKDMDSYYGVDSCLTGINTLKKVVFTEGMERIPDKALYKCTGVTEIVIPGSVKTIGSEAFSGCMALPSIMIPDSVQIIDSKAFSGCTALQAVVFADPDGWTVKQVIKDVTNPEANAIDLRQTNVADTWKQINIKHTVTFVANGVTVGTVRFKEGDTSVAEPAVPHLSGYTGAWNEYVLGTADMTVAAVYTPITYTVTFIADGKTVGTTTYTVENQSIKYPLVPEKVNYEGKWQETVLSVGDVEIHAIYTPLKSSETTGDSETATTEEPNTETNPESATDTEPAAGTTIDPVTETEPEATDTATETTVDHRIETDRDVQVTPEEVSTGSDTSPQGDKGCQSVVSICIWILLLSGWLVSKKHSR